MSEETKEPEAAAKPRSGIVSTLIVVAVVLALAGGGGFLLYRMVLAPRLVVEEVEEEAHGEDGDVIPMLPVSVEFSQKYVNLMRVGDEPASTLVFQVTLECNNQATADIITMHKARFEDMIIKLHDSRTRDELDDVLALKTSIQRQAKQKANDLLARIGVDPEAHAEEGAGGEIMVTEVFHNLFMVQD